MKRTLLTHRCHRPRRALVVALTVPAAVALGSVAWAQTATPTNQVASGVVTSLSGSTAQVQNTAQNSEATVTFGASTVYDKIETVATSTIHAGDCVRVTGTGSTTKGISAAAIVLSAATNGSCENGAGPNGAGTFGAGTIGGAGGGGGGFTFGNGQRPNGATGQGGNRQGANANGGQRSNGTNGNRLNIAAAAGSVVSVSSSGMTVKATIVAQVTPPKSTTTTTKKSSSKSSSPTTTTKPKVKTTNVKVTFSNTTTVTETVSATQADVVLGACVTAFGPLVSGAVNATNVTVSQATNGNCRAGGRGGFGGRGGRGGGGNGTGNGSTGGTGTTGTATRA